MTGWADDTGSLAIGRREGPGSVWEICNDCPFDGATGAGTQQFVFSFFEQETQNDQTKCEGERATIVRFRKGKKRVFFEVSGFRVFVWGCVYDLVFPFFVEVIHENPSVRLL